MFGCYPLGENYCETGLVCVTYVIHNNRNLFFKNAFYQLGISLQNDTSLLMNRVIQFIHHMSPYLGVGVQCLGS